jgi:hypothetical protein
MTDSVADDDATGRELSKQCAALQSAADLAWRNATMAYQVARTIGGTLTIADGDRALEHYRAARALQLAAEQLLLDHIAGRHGP